LPGTYGLMRRTYSGESADTVLAFAFIACPPP
jgi:hypothetical protein